MKNLNRYIHITKKSNYEKLLKSGMFWEFHPELTGDWEKDKNTFKRPSTKEFLKLIEKLPDSESHMHICNESGKQNYYITNEFFAGSFAGRSFVGDSYESAAEKLIDYMYEHINHNSIVGKAVTDSGFPDLEKLYNYCKPNPILED